MYSRRSSLQINNLNFHVKQLEKKQSKPKLGRRKKIVRAEVTEMGWAGGTRL